MLHLQQHPDLSAAASVVVCSNTARVSGNQISSVSTERWWDGWRTNKSQLRPAVGSHLEETELFATEGDMTNRKACSPDWNLWEDMLISGFLPLELEVAQEQKLMVYWHL
jgi:hypothetical protein